MRRPVAILPAALAAALLLAAAGCGPSRRPPASRPAQPGASAPARHVQEGIASWYGKRFQGRRTASGERFDMHQLTAAHPRLAFGTRVRVTNLGNGRKVVVRINDRGPFVKGRIIDLSWAAASEVDMVRAGVARVRVEVIGS